jgi:hypothetical protein
MKTINFFTKALLAAALIFAISCQKDEVEKEEVIKTDISGVVQKGPFNVGTTVTLSELNEDFSQTGKTFVTQINSDDGLFELTGIELSGQYVEMKADGFYFDEVKGENSAAKLTLNAIADVNDKNTLNINVLTHLEKPRVEYLLANGSTFSEAKAKAKQEVLDIFNFSATGNGTSETLDITKPGAENACLLAVSAVVQGYRSVADVSEMLTSIAKDLKEDGTLGNAELQTKLISHALFISPEQVWQNINNKYNELSASVQVQQFGQYLEQFISSTTFLPLSLIIYPEQSSKGLNILNSGNSAFDSGMQTSYSMAAETIRGIGLKIELKVVEGTLEGMAAGWGYQSDKINWDATVYDRETHSQTFEVIDTAQPANLKIIFMSPGLKIQIKYIEGNRERVRIITVN